MKQHENIFNKRYFSISEILVRNYFFQLAGLLIIAVLLPAWLLWPTDFSVTLQHNVRFPTIQKLCLIVFCITTSFHALKKYPITFSFNRLISVVLFWFLIVILICMLLRIRISYNLVLASLLLSILSIVIISKFFIKDLFESKIIYIPLGKTEDLLEIKSVNWIKLEKPTDEISGTFDAIVTDFPSKELNNEWNEFLSQCILNGIPVYDKKEMEEFLTGRVKIEDISDNSLSTLLSSPVYLFTKQLVDVSIVVLSFPFILPIMAIIAILIKLDSPGPVFFTQKRIGQKAKEFDIYKFRSMTVDSEKDGAKLATKDDKRITKIGRFIRKTRLDELPQLINVLKGDMSLIGPRPEQKIFVDQFKNNILFYNCRHVLKPGLSGWAQVRQGYAGSEDETQIKIEYDFYYMKHLSIWLDLWIVFKTIKTILTGFGAR